MKSFDHRSNAHNDKFIRNLAANFGMEGVGRWWTMLEIIAGETKSDIPSATLEISVWCSCLLAKPKKLMEFLEYCEDKNKIKLIRFENKPETKRKQTQNELGVVCKKLRELNQNTQIDTTTRSSGDDPKNLGRFKVIKPNGDTPPNGIGATGGLFLEFDDPTLKKIHKSINKHKVACGATVEDSSIEVRSLFDDLCQIDQLSNEPIRTLAYLLQARKAKPRSPVGAVYALIATPKYAPSDESMEYAKTVYAPWNTPTNIPKYKHRRIE